ncbi:hypothetical protein Hypma_008841 [Hypsizygus marmoreus]|uniref:Uncharacterized protein n=1 Tax=Hypsizygus marmoreus TaxID=39966 RepID=A0A369JS62_HYPMA|nr:hypothetical protein Hypma_008841 [Hypsizygus marmoreus]
MMFAAALIALLLPAFASAQYGAPAPAPSPTVTKAAVPTAPADTSGHMNIDVAFQQTFTFHPSNITAPNGTLVTFWFPDNGLDHSVTQSSFNAPCTYLTASGDSPAGFDSGLQSAKQFTINITDDTKRMCPFMPNGYQRRTYNHTNIQPSGSTASRQVSHCGLGMVGSINAPSTGNTFDSFLAAATKIGSSETTETDNGPVTGGVGGVATAGPAAAGATTTAGNTGNTGNNSGGIKMTFSTGLALLAGVCAVGFALS